MRCKGRNRKTWKECVDDDMKVFGLCSEWKVFRDMWRWRDFISEICMGRAARGPGLDIKSRSRAGPDV